MNIEKQREIKEAKDKFVNSIIQEIMKRPIILTICLVIMLTGIFTSLKLGVQLTIEKINQKDIVGISSGICLVLLGLEGSFVLINTFFEKKKTKIKKGGDS